MRIELSLISPGYTIKTTLCLRNQNNQRTNPFSCLPWQMLLRWIIAGQMLYMQRHVLDFCSLPWVCSPYLSELKNPLLYSTQSTAKTRENLERKHPSVEGIRKRSEQPDSVS